MPGIEVIIGKSHRKIKISRWKYIFQPYKVIHQAILVYLVHCTRFYLIYFYSFQSHFYINVPFSTLSDKKNDSNSKQLQHKEVQVLTSFNFVGISFYILKWLLNLSPHWKIKFWSLLTRSSRCKIYSAPLMTTKALWWDTKSMKLRIMRSGILSSGNLPSESYSFLLYKEKGVWTKWPL